MARQSWLLVGGRPCIEIWLKEPFTGFLSKRVLLADTGGGARFSPIEIILSSADARQFGTLQDVQAVGMGGAIQGEFSIHLVHIEIPALNVSRFVDVAGVPTSNFFPGTQGFACFRFLNNFNYGNGSNPAEFALQTI